MLAPYDFEASVGYWVVMTAQALRKALDEELAPYGITYRQWQVLAWLATEGPVSQAELAERMNIEPATLVSVLSRMERDGWVRREECAADRRKRLVFPTAGARPVWEQGCECARRVRARASQGLNDEELLRMRGLLERIRENASPEAVGGRQKDEGRRMKAEG